MTKIFKQTLKFLFNCLLVTGLVISAHQAMNLPLGWPSVGYALIFIVDLVVLLSIGEADAHYKGFVQGMELQKMINQTENELDKNINSGKDKFTMKISNRVINVNTDNKDDLIGQIVCDDDVHNIYEITSASNCGTESELTFTKIHPHSDETKQLD